MRRKSSNNSNKSYFNSIAPINLGSRKRQSLETPNSARLTFFQKSKEDDDLEAFKQLILRLGKSLIDGFFTNAQMTLFRDYLKEIGKQGKYIIESQNKFNDQNSEIESFFEKWNSFERDFYEVFQMSDSARKNVYIQLQLNQFIAKVDKLIQSNQQAYDNISPEFDYYHEIANICERISSMAIDFESNSEKLKNTLQKLAKNLSRIYYSFFTELIPNISECDEFILECCSYIQCAEKACTIGDLNDQDIKKTFDIVYDLVRKLFEPLINENPDEEATDNNEKPIENDKESTDPNNNSFSNIFDKLFMNSIHPEFSNENSPDLQDVQYEIWLNKNAEDTPPHRTLAVNTDDQNSVKSRKKRNTLDSRIAIEISQIDNRLDSSLRSSRAFKESINRRFSLLKSRSSLQIQLYKANENAKKEIRELKEEIDKLRSEIIHSNVYDSDVGPTIDPRYTEELRKMYNETNTEYFSNLVELRNKLNQDIEDELDSLKNLNNSLLDNQKEINENSTKELNENNSIRDEQLIAQEIEQIENEEESHNSDNNETLKLVIAKRMNRSCSTNNLFDKLKNQNNDEENSEIDNANKNNSSVNSTSGNKFKNNSDYQNLGSDYEQNEMIAEDEILSMGNKSSSSERINNDSVEVDIVDVALAPLNIPSSTTSENEIKKNRYTINSNEMSSEHELSGNEVINIRKSESQSFSEEEIDSNEIHHENDNQGLAEENFSIENDTERLTEEIADLKVQLRAVNNHCFSLRNANRMKTHISLDSLSLANSNNSIVQIATELVRTENQRLYENLKEIESLIQDEEDRIQLFLSSHPKNLINASQTANSFLTKRLNYLKTYLQNHLTTTEDQTDSPADQKTVKKGKNLQIYQISDEAKEVFINLEKARNNFNEIIEKANYLLSDLDKIDNVNKKKISQFISKEMENHLFVIRMNTENARIESELKNLEEESVRISRRFGGVPIGKGERKALYSVKKAASLVANRNYSRAMDAIKNYIQSKH